MMERFFMNLGSEKQIRVFGLLWVMFVGAGFLNGKSWAAGKRGTDLACPVATPQGQVAYRTPVPVRRIRLPQIATKVFQLPNGAQADINVDLQTILNTAVTSTISFSPTDETQDGPCHTHLELRSAVTAFQMDLAELGVSFGYSPAGPINVGTHISGDAHAKVGTIAMDFSLWQCEEGHCAAVAASTSNHTVAGGNVKIDMNFGTIQTGTGLVFNTALGQILRTIMVNGLSQLAASPRVSELAWQSRVRSYDAANGMLVIGAGTQSRIGPNQTFEVYAPTDTSAQGVCDVFQTVAYVHTSTVGTVSSEAVVDEVLDSRGILPGDVVMVRSAGVPKLQ